MIDVIGTGKSGAPLVLAELNEAEKMAMTDILFAAERAIENGAVRLGRDEPIVQAMAGELRRIFGIGS